MRTEYLNGEMSRLKGLANYSLGCYPPLTEPNGEQTYRTILEGIINVIWESAERTERVINLARESVEESRLIQADPQQIQQFHKKRLPTLFVKFCRKWLQLKTMKLIDPRECRIESANRST